MLSHRCDLPPAIGDGGRHQRLRKKTNSPQKQKRIHRHRYGEASSHVQVCAPTWSLCLTVKISNVEVAGFYCRFWRFCFQNAVRILVVITPIRWKRLCHFHISGQNEAEIIYSLSCKCNFDQIHRFCKKLLSPLSFLDSDCTENMVFWGHGAWIANWQRRKQNR